MKREMLDTLMAWKDSSNKKSLLLLGARQVGKTYLVRQFGNECYKNFIEINFEFDTTARTIFENDLNIDDLIMKLSMHSRKSINKDTLIFFDEIQVCPRAIVALNLFTQSNYDVVASGSLLGVSLNSVTSFPVGYVDTYTLYPMNFKEFLWSQGIDDNVINHIHQCYLEKKQVDEFIHNQMNDLLLKYVVVGGMPAVVKQFNKDKDFEAVMQEYMNCSFEEFENDLQLDIKECKFEDIVEDNEEDKYINTKIKCLEDYIKYDENNIEAYEILGTLYESTKENMK